MTKYTTIDELPLTLNVEDISSITGLCLSKAYELCRSKGFPSVIIGRRIIVPKLAFISWMQTPTVLEFPDKRQ